MKLDEFNQLFEEYFATPLHGAGFEYVANSKTLALTKNYSQLVLFRLGGKFSRPGHINQIICVRHNFLRTIEDDEIVSFTNNLGDFPYKLTLADFSKYVRFIPIYRYPKYKPINSGIRDTELLRFDNCSKTQVIKKLQYQKDIILKRVVPWAATLNENEVAAQLEKYNEQAWCEVRWLEDYKNQK